MSPSEYRRDVFLSPLWKLHVGYHLNELAPYPPDGYRFVMAAKKRGARVFDLASKLPLALSLLHGAARLAPINLLKSALDARLGGVPPDVALTYCCHHVSFDERPWVIEMDAVWDPIGPDPRQFRRYWPKADAMLASDACKRVLVFSEFSRQTLLSISRHDGMEEKVVVLPRAVRAKEHVPRRRPGRAFNLLFVGSANVAGMFEMRGGKEVLAAFRSLSRRYRDVRLTIRAGMPRRLQDEYRDVLALENVTYLPQKLAAGEMEALYASADALLMPGHYDNWLVVLEAMSYQLPVITTDLFANSERVVDGCNGFLVRPAKHVPYYQDGLPLFGPTPAFQRAIKVVDAATVADVVDKTARLIEDRALAERMGLSAREEIERGRFSIANRNRVLKEVFDAALD